MNLGLKSVCVVTDPNVAKLPPLAAALDSLSEAGVTYSVFEDISIEPTNERLVFICTYQ